MLSRTSRPVTTALRRLVRTEVTQSTPSPPQSGTPVPSPTPSQNLPPVEAPPPQAPNKVERWSTMQAPRPATASRPRFEQTDMSLQPRPLSAMQLVSEDPIRIIPGRKAVCDGGEYRVSFLCVFNERSAPSLLQEVGHWDIPKSSSTWCALVLVESGLAVTFYRTSQGLTRAGMFTRC
jgi:hypothetical protein